MTRRFAVRREKWTADRILLTSLATMRRGPANLQPQYAKGPRRVSWTASRHGTPPGTRALFAPGFVELLLLRLMASEMSTNVMSVEVSRRINPEQPASLDRVDFNTAAQDRTPVRRLTRLDAEYYASRGSEPTQRGPAGRSARGSAGGSAARSVPKSAPKSAPGPADEPRQRDSAWLRFLERVVGGWAPTLRGSLVLVALFLCAVVLLVVALGLTGLLISGALAAIGYWLNATGRLPRA